MVTGTGSKAGFHDVEIIDDQLGKQIITKFPFAGQTLASASHADKLVVTQVVLDKGENNYDKC